MKHYETIFIINPNLGDEEYGEVLSKFRDLIDKLKGVTVKVEEWGKQKLAYRLKKFDSGFYVLVDHCGDPGVIVELERNLKLDERILKYQTVKLADKADPEALIREEEKAKEKHPVKAAEGLSIREEGLSIREEGLSGGGKVSAKADEVSAEADKSAKADEVSAKADEVSAKADEVSAKADEVPAKVDEVPAKADEVPAKADEVPAEAGKKREEETKVEGSAEADSPVEAKKESAEPAEESAEAEEVGPSTGGAESAKAEEVSAKADEIPQEETNVQKEGEKKS